MYYVASARKSIFNCYSGRYIRCSESSSEDALEFVVVPNFITKEEELGMMAEINKIWRHPKYEYCHWDNVRACMSPPVKQ